MEIYKKEVGRGIDLNGKNYNLQSESNMLYKLFNIRKLSTPFSSRTSKKSSNPVVVPTVATIAGSSRVKIVHAGGIVECYYMPIPAARVMEKYPSFLLARPEVFRRPWDSLVRPDEILMPGERFYVVPCHTVQKLRRKIQQPGTDLSSTSFSFDSKSTSSMSSLHVSEQSKNEFSTDSIASDQHKVKVARQGCIQNSILSKPPSHPNTVGSQRARTPGKKKKKTKKMVIWNPTLTAIREASPARFADDD